jgi:hypothetical protein
MSIDHELPFPRRGLLRVRAVQSEFRQRVRSADIILAADLRHPPNTWVVYHDPRLQKEDNQDEKTAEILAVPVDVDTDDAEVLGNLCRVLKGVC